MKAIDSERTTMAKEIEAQAASARADIERNVSQSKTALKENLHQAKAEIEQVTAQKSADIDTRIDQALTELETCTQADLTRLEQMVADTCAQVDATTEQAKSRIADARNNAVHQADTIAAQTVAKIRTLTAEGHKKIDDAAAKAKMKIDQRSKAALAQLDTAHAKHSAEIKFASTQATNVATSFAQKVIDDGNQAVTDLVTQADAGITQLTQMRTRLGAEIDDQFVADALAEANTRLERSYKDVVVTDSDAIGAMNVLSSLPPDLQSRAIDELDNDTFDELLSEMPEERALEMRGLYDNTSDPEKKLRIWGAVHKSESYVKEQSLKKDVPLLDFGSRDAIANETRERTRKETSREVDDEVKFLLEKAKKGTLTAADVEKLDQRKTKELRIEMEYNINITNKRGVRTRPGADKGTKIVWEDNELTQLEAALHQLPEDHVKYNPMLEEIHRSDMKVSKNKDRPSVGGSHGKGIVTIYDQGFKGNFEHGGDDRKLNDPAVGPPVGPKVTGFEETLIHEIGHDIHDLNDDAFKDYQRVGGWDVDLTEDDLKYKGLTPAQIEELNDSNKSGKIVLPSGRVIQRDKYREGRFQEYEKGAMPDEGAGTWSYAQTHTKDHFAEHYDKAVIVPEQVATDMLDEPAQRVASAKADLAHSQANLNALRARTSPPASSQELAAAEKKLATAKSGVTNAEYGQRMQQAQFNIMRNRIFKTDKTTTEAIARLKAKGVPEAKINEFKAKAARASTPQQVEFIEKGY